MYLKLLVYFLSISLLIDQIIKYFVLYYLNLIELIYMEIIPGYLNFIMAWNKGVNFGLFNNSNINTKFILIFVSIIICFLLFYWVKKKKEKKSFIFAGLVIGGALGNCLDRFIFGAVVDYLNVTCCGLNNPYSFNLADTFIFVGVLGLIIFNEKDKKKIIDQ